MKKYLMTGVAAFAICAAFTSCSKGEELYDQGAVEEMTTASEVQKIYSNYENAFQKAFGTPAPNHAWGFSDSKSATRSVDVNGNLWESRPEVTAEEAAAVYAWVNRPKSQIPAESYYEESPVNLQNFFVTQVWGSKDNENDPNCRYLNGDQMKNAANGQTYNLTDKVWGSTKMNHLQISTSSARLGDGVANLDATWDHANNFNAGQNRDWDGNTMFVGWGTQNFAYHSTEDSKYHDKWIIVDGAYITDSKGENHAGKYYVCFDFIATNPETKTNAHASFWNAKGNGGGEWVYKNFQIPGYYTLDQLADLTLDVEMTDVSTNTTYTQTFTLKNEENKVKDLAIENYDKGNMVIPANDYYTDWIVRLVEAQPKTTPADLRVMAEDLSAGDDDKDFDFNDVVFDVYFSPNQGEAYVMVVAAGGTLPLTVHGTEVHGLFGQPTNVMINTHAEDKGLNGISNLPAQRIQLTGITVNSKSDVNTKVHIWVKKKIKDANGGTKEQDVELVNSGAAACKIGVRPTCGIALERTNVNTVLNMNEWVTSGALEPTYPN